MRIKLAAFVLLTGGTWWLAGWEVCLACLVAVSIHEAGHWGYAMLFGRRAGLRASVFVSPVVGYVSLGEESMRAYCRRHGLAFDEDDYLPGLVFGPFWEGGFFLAGSVPNALLAWGLTWYGAHLPMETCGLEWWLYALWWINLFTLLVNLLVLVPMLDGGRLVLLLFVSHPRRRRYAIQIALLLPGMAFLLWFDWFCFILVALAGAYLFTVPFEVAIPTRHVFGLRRRCILAAAWALLAGSSLYLFSRG
ncbi:MAG: hypothetical protein EOM20_09745 [Spartobacteria bacterium]|nr:hypothetical protein [Spartobacteria bacterium]